jgi:hypothetical protein
MTGARLFATWGGVAKCGSDWGIVAALIGGILLSYVCIGFGVYALLSAIL